MSAYNFSYGRMARACLFWIPVQLTRCLLVVLVYLGWGRINAANAWRKTA